MIVKRTVEVTITTYDFSLTTLDAPVVARYVRTHDGAKCTVINWGYRSLTIAVRRQRIGQS